ncbi:MAG: hypothetical protein GY742_15700 [Hyphomicrobiales bacterium]|nr:hypothetical protein [Hyphomicrobiales bacterium]
MRPVNSTIRNSLIAAVLGTTTIAASPVAAEEVYMIRGFMNVFSAGMNEMTARLKRYGIRASSHSNGDWKGLAQNIISRSKRGKVSYPIIIVGHSLGGVDAPNFANALGKKGVKVGLVIGLDPGFSTPASFGPNVKQVVNYKIPSGQYYRRGRGFSGSIRNIDVSRYGVDHVGIDKSPQVQGLVISRIRSKVGK